MLKPVTVWPEERVIGPEGVKVVIVGPAVPEVIVCASAEDAEPNNKISVSDQSTRETRRLEVSMVIIIATK